MCRVVKNGYINAVYKPVDSNNKTKKYVLLWEMQPHCHYSQYPPIQYSVLLTAHLKWLVMVNGLVFTIVCVCDIESVWRAILSTLCLILDLCKSKTFTQIFKIWFQVIAISCSSLCTYVLMQLLCGEFII